MVHCDVERLIYAYVNDAETQESEGRECLRNHLMATANRPNK